MLNDPELLEAIMDEISDEELEALYDEDFDNLDLEDLEEYEHLEDFDDLEELSEEEIQEQLYHFIQMEDWHYKKQKSLIRMIGQHYLLLHLTGKLIRKLWV